MEGFFHGQLEHLPCFDQKIVADQRCGEILWVRIERQHASGLEFCDGVMSPHQNVCGGTSFCEQSGLVFSTVAFPCLLFPCPHWIKKRLVSDDCDQREVSADGGFEVGADPLSVAVINYVGEHNQERPLLAMPSQVEKSRVCPALDQPRLNIVDSRHHTVELPATTPRRQPANDVFVVTEKASLVTLGERHVGQGQRCVKGRVEKRFACSAIDHHSAAVDREDDPLALI